MQRSAPAFNYHSKVLVILGLAAIALLVTSCGDSRNALKELPPNSSPKPTPSSALEALFTAEKNHDYSSSYELLSKFARNNYPDINDWTRRRSLLADVTDFKIGDAQNIGAQQAEVNATVKHNSRIDSVVGLIPQSEEQIWTAVKSEMGWLLDADPIVHPHYPPEDNIRTVASLWIEAVQACDRNSANALQAVTTIFGNSEQAETLCGSSGGASVGGVERAKAGPETDELIAQYGSTAMSWTRAVPIVAPTHFRLLLAPVGSEWKVIGLSE